MSNSSTLLDTIATNQSNKEVVVNALLDAASPAMLWGRHASACSGLTWGYYGGNYQVGATSNAVANGTVALTASTTNYVYADNVTGAVSANTTGVPSGKIALYSIATGTATVTSYTDLRSYQPGGVLPAGAGTVTSVGLAAPTEFSVTGSPVSGSGTLTLTKAAQAVNSVWAGPASGGSAAPTFRALVAADLPVMVASGASHAAGAVPDPGATAGTTRYLREDGTWAVPSGGTSGSAMNVDVQTGTTYTIAATDAPQASNYQGVVTMNNAASNVVTIPTNATVALPVGTQLQISQLGAGSTSVAAAAGVTLSTSSTLICRVQYSSLVLTKVATDTWLVGGDMQ
jgi:hypothetical protein